jgi:hypothetical protein
MLDDTLFHNAWHNAARSRIPAVLDQGRKASLTLNLTQLFNVGGAHGAREGRVPSMITNPPTKRTLKSNGVMRSTWRL